MSIQISGAFGFQPTFGAGAASPFGAASVPGLVGPGYFPAGFTQLLQQLIGALSELSSGWGGFLGGGYPGGAGAGSPYGGGYGGGAGVGSPYGGGYGGGAGVGSPYGGGYGGYPSTGASTGGSVYGGYPTVGTSPYGGTTTSTGGGGVYGSGGVSSTGGATSTGGAPPLQFPSDPQDYASYLQAQLAGGTLQGGTGIAQKDAIPGTRFAKVQNSELWQADVARQYAYQFAAYANGDNPLTAQGLAAGAQAFQKMSPQAQLFMQVASVFKGNLFGGPGNYNNPGLKQLLVSHGLNNLADKSGVGQTDVQTIGAIASAINSGSLSLNDVINSGTIDNLNRYDNIINYVETGGFANDVAGYDSVAV